MVYGSKQRESFSRRRLDFAEVSSPVYGKSFYLDLRKPLLKEKVIKCIRHLGGKVEDFLCKEIDLLITDRPVSMIESREATLKESQYQNPSSPNCTPLPSPDTPLSSRPASSSSLFTPSSAKPLTRTQTLLLKAQQSYKQNQNRDTSTNTSTIQNAISMGIKVLTAEVFLDTYLQHCKRNKADETFRFEDDPVLSSRSSRVTRSNSAVSPDFKENKPCVKVEDFSRKYKPLFKTFERLPEISYELGLNSRTSNSKKRQKTTPRTVSATPKGNITGQKSVPRPSTVKSQKQLQRGGYCESCDYWYTGRVREHLAGSRHQQFAKNIENYTSLDTVISKLPGFDAFLSSVNPLCRVPNVNLSCDIEMTDVSRDDKNIGSQTQSLIPKNMMEVASEKKFWEADDKKCPDVIETDDTPLTTGRPKVLRKLLAKCTIVECSDDNMSVSGEHAVEQQPTVENTGMAPARRENQPIQDEIDGDILSIVNAVNKNIVRNFEEDDNFNSVDLDPPELERYDIFNIKPIFTERAPVLQPISVNCQPVQVNTVPSRKPSPRKRLDFGQMGDKKTIPEQSLSKPSLPQPFIFGRDDPLRSPSDLLMRFVQAASTNQTLEEDVTAKRKRRRSRDESASQNVYYAMKTSEMKLKLCRVSDKEKKMKHKKDLKSYWKVRKSGDCKLVFSPKYSRKFNYQDRPSRRLNAWNQENEPPLESQEPSGKRAKVDSL